MEFLDRAMVLFWIIVYVLILWNGRIFSTEARLMIPPLACILNLSWEINAVIQSHGMWGHMLWLVLDIGVFVQCLSYIYRKAKTPMIYVVLYIVITALCFQFFYDIFRNQEGMLISSFIINLIMSILFVILHKQIYGGGKKLIAFAKLMGTMCAIMTIGKEYIHVIIVGIVVFLIDLFYVALCMEEQVNKKRKGRSKK